MGFSDMRNFLVCLASSTVKRVVLKFDVFEVVIGVPALQSISDEHSL